MADQRLEARTPLDGYRRVFGTTTLEEISAGSLHALSVSASQRSNFAVALSDTVGLSLPEVGTSTANEAGTERCYGLQRHQWFLSRSSSEPLDPRVTNSCWPVDQSDSWVQLTLAGPASRAALERLCPIDLHPTRFEVNDVARTLVEHMNAIVIRTGDDTFLLLSARSTAHDFMQAIETALESVAT